MPPLLLRSGLQNSSPCSRWESKKRRCLIKQTTWCTRHSSGSPKCFSNGNSYAICICTWMCLSISLKLEVGREALLEQKKQQAWYLCSLYSLSITCHFMLPNNLSMNIRIQDPFQCHRFSSWPKNDYFCHSQSIEHPAVLWSKLRWLLTFYFCKQWIHLFRKSLNTQ